MQRQGRKDMGLGRVLLISCMVGFGIPLLLVVAIFVLADHPVSQIGSLLELGIVGGVFWTLILMVLLFTLYRVTLRKTSE